MDTTPLPGFRYFRLILGSEVALASPSSWLGLSLLLICVVERRPSRIRRSPLPASFQRFPLLHQRVRAFVGFPPANLYPAVLRAFFGEGSDSPSSALPDLRREKR